MQPSQGTGIEQAARELIQRLGQRGALSFIQERVERLVQDGDWISHAAAARVLSAIEQAAGAWRPSEPAAGSKPGAT